MRRSADAFDLVHADPANGPGCFANIRRVNEQDDVRHKAAQGRSAVLRGVTGFQDEDRVEIQKETGPRQAAGNQYTGRVIRPQRVANPEDRNPRLSILALCPLLQELAC